MPKKRLITGFKPTGELHLGNFAGVMQRLPQYQDEYESLIFIPDYHALTSVNDAKKLKEYTVEAAKALLAIGLDPEKTIIFKQSDVPEVTELAWIFNCILSMPILERAHAYKDAKTKNTEINIGIFDYPVLMAADILIYGSNVVPVGKDQLQHIEYARILAKKFNHIYGSTFPVPEALTKKEIELLPGLDGKKMSKSYHNTIALFASAEQTTKKVMSIITDSLRPEEPKDPQKCNIFALHKYFTLNLEEISTRYRQGKISYKESKEILAQNLNKKLEPIRAKKQELDQSPDYILEILEKGGKKARELARVKMDEVRKKTGLVMD